MRKNMKTVLAKSLAVAMAFSLVGIAPSTSSDAAAKKPTLTKKVTVTVGKTKTVKVTSKKKVKKTTWSLTKKGKKVVSLSKKKAKSVVVKGKKKGSATLTEKIKVGSKTYKKTCKITVKKATPTAKPTAKVTATAKTTAAPTSANNGGNNKPSATPTSTPVNKFVADDATLTVDEKSTVSIPVTSLNETSMTCDAKHIFVPGTYEQDGVVKEKMPPYEECEYNKDGSVTWTSNVDYSSGVSYYLNPCTDQSKLTDVLDENGNPVTEGAVKQYDCGTKNVREYDYIRVKWSAPVEMNIRTYENPASLIKGGAITDAKTVEDYEGNWKFANGEPPMEQHKDSNDKDLIGKDATAGNVIRTAFIPLKRLEDKGADLTNLAAISFCPQRTGITTTIYAIDLVKVNYDKPVTGIEVTAKKTTIKNGKTTTCEAAITPEDATRTVIDWSSSDETIAKVNSKGVVSANDTDKTGTVTITATATDGSGVSGSVEITVGETTTATPTPTPPAGEGAPTYNEDGSVSFDLSADEIVGSTNDGSKTITENVTKDADGIKYSGKYTMQMLDFSAYLEKYELDLSDYKDIVIEGKLLDAEGNEVTCEAGKVKTGLVDANNLTGYADGMQTTGKWKNFPTITIDMTGIDAGTLATAVGLSMQLTIEESMQAYETMLISAIKLVPAGE